MAAAKVTIAQKYGLPQFSEDGDFDSWKRDMEFWELVTDLPKKKQGPVVYLSLSEKVRQACSSLTKEELNEDDGLNKITNKLKELYSVTEDQAMFNAYENFETFQRPNDMNICEYINKFEQLNQKLVNFKITLPSAVLAYQLLKNANLPPATRDLIRATVASLTYDAMKKQIKAIYDQCVQTGTKTSENAVEVENEVMYGKDSDRRFNRYYRGSNTTTRGSRSSSRVNHAARRRTNPIGPDGKPMQCHACKSIMHFKGDCPDKDVIPRGSEQVHFQLYSNEQCFLEQVVSESLNCALLDCGCSSTVCGKNWLQCYLDTLPEGVDLQERSSTKSFKFGPGQSYVSLKQVNIPVDIGGLPAKILTDVVDCEIPLLLSTPSLKAANSQLDFVNDVINMYGRTIPLQHTSSGHYCIPLSSDAKPSVIHPVKSTEITLAAIHVEKKDLAEKRAIATKLHKQFGHPVDSGKLKALLHDADIHDKELLQQIDLVGSECDTCSRYMKVRSRPVVSLPLASDVNECLALDLKFITINHKKFIILHMIDVFAKFSAASIVRSKHKEVIVDAIMKHWVATFGTPISILSDNGGEFNNELLRDVAELLGAKVCTTAAESPWSNGVVERHNAVIGNMILKIVDSSGCSVENALVWAVSAKNALHNNRGFSPNQLVFGRNPNLPSVLTAKPPALRTVTPSHLIAEHLNALHAARQAFIKCEASKKIKTALQHQTRTATSKSFQNGEMVYYKRRAEKEWRGPAIVLGIEGKQILVKHGGLYYRVSPCSLQSVKGISIDNNDQQNIPEAEHCESDDCIKAVLDLAPVDDEPPATVAPSNESASAVTPDNVSDLNSRESAHPLLESPTDDVSLPVISESKTISQEVVLPKLRERVTLVDPDTNQKADFVVVSRAGKAGGRHKYWFNVKNMHNSVIKAIDFEKVKWEKLADESVFSVSLSHEVIVAQEAELQKWKDYNVYKEVTDKGQDVITTRWVITEKVHDGNTQIKARLVARGFEEDSLDIRTDSPTISKENFRLVCSIGISNGWKIHSLDVKAAFLQGSEIGRAVHLLPPPEANTAKLWKLNTPVYGLCDAPRAWYEKLADELTKVGATKSNLDNALFFWRPHNNLEGVLCCHVDDCFFVGSDLFHHTIIDHIRSTFSLSKESSQSFNFLGLELRQNDHDIVVQQSRYINEIQPIQMKSTSLTRLLNQQETRQLKALVGQIQWVAKQTRPDAAYTGCVLSTKVKHATVADVRRANKQLKQLQQTKIAVKISDIGDLEDASLLLYSDASHANLAGGGSQGGFVIFLQGSNSALAPLIWKSHKLKRVVKSAMGAETMALLEGAEHALLIKAIIYEISCVELPLVCLCDNKSLVTSVKSTKLIEDKRLYIDICALRQMLQKREISELQLITSKEQLADCLTKGTASPDNLLRAVSDSKSC